MWPDAQRSAFAFTFDLDAEALWLDDDLELDDAVLRSHGRYASQVAVPAILERLERHGVRATFFVVGMVAEAQPHVVSSILEAGHEVAAHGYSHRPPTDLSKKDRAEELERVRGVLEAIGADAVGYRAPHWRLPAKGIAELDAHGFRYSSNLMDDVRPYRHPGTQVIELPVHWALDDVPHALLDPRDWTGRIAPNETIRQVWRAEAAGIHEMGGLTVLTMHPQVIGRPGRLALLDEMLGSMADRDDVWVATCAAIAEHVEAASE